MFYCLVLVCRLLAVALESSSTLLLLKNIISSLLLLLLLLLLSLLLHVIPAKVNYNYFTLYKASSLNLKIIR